MSSYLPYIVIGLTTGSVYGIAALGLVLTYKTSGLFNFGYGAIGAGAAVVFFELRQRHSVPWPIAAFVAVVIFGVITGFIMERMSAALAEAPPTYKIVATVGLILIVPALVSLFYGAQNQLFSPFLPQKVAFRISGVRVGWDEITIAALGLTAAAALYMFFQWSRLGKLMRAVVDRPDLVDLTGESPTRVRRIAWMVGSGFAAVSGVLLASTQQQLDATFLSLLVVSAFGAAAVGAFTNLPLAYAGGILLGVVQAVAGRITAQHPTLQGLDFNMPFIFLFILLLVLPKGKLVELGQRVSTIARASKSSRTLVSRTGVPVAVLVIAILVPLVVGTHLPTWESALAEMPLFLSLGLLVHTSGQNSLCQIGFAAIGATTFAHLLGSGVPWVLAVLLAGLVLVPIGALIALPAIRLSGLYLGLATLGFGILVAQFFYSKGLMFGVQAQLATRRPQGFGGDRAFYYLLLAVAVLAIGVVMLVERSRLGRILSGLADSPVALSTLGANTNIPRVMVFSISAFIAGIAGAVAASQFPSISPDGYNYVSSLTVLAALIICGRRTISAAIIATILFSLPTGYLRGSHTGDFVQLAFGLAAVIVGVTASGRLGQWMSTLPGRYEERRTGPAGDRTPVSARRVKALFSSSQ